jgi:hypothetical protein
MTETRRANPVDPDQLIAAFIVMRRSQPEGDCQMWRAATTRRRRCIDVCAGGS